MKKSPVFIKETPDFESMSTGIGYQTLAKPSPIVGIE